MRIIELNVMCANGDFSDVPNKFIVEITQPLMSQIIKLRRVVKENTLYQATKFSCEGDWVYKEDDDEAAEVEHKRTECEIMVVTDDYVKWEAYPKHGTSQEALETTHLSITELLKG